MNKKGQLLYMILSLVVIGIVWVVGLASFLSEVGQTAAASTTGLEAFFWANLNLSVGLFYLIAWFVVIKIG